MSFANIEVKKEGKGGRKRQALCGIGPRTYKPMDIGSATWASTTYCSFIPKLDEEKISFLFRSKVTALLLDEMAMPEKRDIPNNRQLQSQQLTWFGHLRRRDRLIRWWGGNTWRLEKTPNDEIPNRAFLASFANLCRASIKWHWYCNDIESSWLRPRESIVMDLGHREYSSG